MYGRHEDDVLLIIPQEGIYIAMHCMIDYIRKYAMLQHGNEMVAYAPCYSMKKLFQLSNFSLGFVMRLELNQISSIFYRSADRLLRVSFYANSIDNFCYQHYFL